MHGSSLFLLSIHVIGGMVFPPPDAAKLTTIFCHRLLSGCPLHYSNSQENVYLFIKSGVG